MKNEEVVFFSMLIIFTCRKNRAFYCLCSPTTLTGAYDYLVNYKVPKSDNISHDGHELSFYNAETDSSSRGGGRGGRGLGGRNNTRGGGRRGRGDRGSQSSHAHSQGNDQGTEHLDDDPEDDAQFLLDNADIMELVDDYSMLSSTGDTLKNHLVLLDSCSTVNLIVNPKLLHDIHHVDSHVHIRCNAGMHRTNLMGWLGSFPEPVWHDDPGGAANILSLHSVQQHCHVEYDNTVGDQFTVHMATDTICFTPVGKGLYGCPFWHGLLYKQ
jgi:hypothetical protein